MPDPDHPRRRAPLSWPLEADPASHDVRSALLAAYGAADRDYHDLRHLGEVLGALDELAEHGVAFDGDTVRLAAWFHDSVYDGERDAEERSAVWAEEALSGLVAEDAVEEVARLVRLTETHRPADDDLGGCALSDADLAVLAADDDRYAEYVAAVRREYAHVADHDFVRGRAAVLQDLLDKPRLFHTDHGARRWESRARENVAAELTRLVRTVAAVRA